MGLRGSPAILGGSHGIERIGLDPFGAVASIDARTGGIRRHARAPVSVPWRWSEHVFYALHFAEHLFSEHTFCLPYKSGREA